MKMHDIKKIAAKMGVNPGKMNKKDLIRTIQEKEGNTPCFKMERDACDQYDCCWRNDCKPREMAEG